MGIRLVVVVLAIGAACAVGATGAAGAPVGPSISVTPSTGLGNGQSVEVHGEGWPASTDVGFCQGIEDGSPSQQDCASGAGLVRTSSTGSFTGNLTVHRAITVPSRSGPIDCVTEQCVVAAAVFSDIAATVQYIDVTFDPGQPDVRVKNSQTGVALGDDVYNATGAGQTRSHTVVPGSRWTFPVQVQNDGPATDDLVVTATATPAGFSARYFVGYYDVTALVQGGGATLAAVPSGAIRTVAVQINAGGGVAEGAKALLLVTARSAASGAVDAVGVKGVARSNCSLRSAYSGAC